MKTVLDIVRMADAGLELVGDVAINWYENARVEHLRAYKMHTGKEATQADQDILFMMSALASYNASPAAQSRLVAEWMAFDDISGFLPNTSHGLEHFQRHGILGSSKAECYRLAMQNGGGYVVIDRHMLRALGDGPNQPMTYSNKPRGGNAAYNLATRRIKKAGMAMGIDCAAVQAAVWYKQVHDTTGKIYGDDGIIDITRHLRDLERQSA